MMERIYYLEKGGRENYGENKKSRKKSRKWRELIIWKGGYIQLWRE